MIIRRYTLFFACLLLLQILLMPHSASADILAAKNNSNSIISDLPEDPMGGNQFQSLIDRDGNIVYFFNTGGAMGFCMGRYNISTKRWELRTPTGWSSDSNAIAEPLGQSFFSTSDLSNGSTSNSSNYQFLRLSETDSEIFSVVSGKSKIGKSFFDVHGGPFSFTFDGERWSSYDGTNYNPNMIKVAVVPIWNKATQFHFATNGRGQGLLISRGQPSINASTNFYAARFDRSQGAQNDNHLWAAWRRIGQNRNWMANSAQLEPLFQGFSEMEEPVVGYAGQDQLMNDIYLFVGTFSNQTRVFKYNDGTKTWWIWNGSWQIDTGQTVAQSILTPGYSVIDPPGRMIRFQNEVLYLYQRVVTGRANLWYAKTDGTQDFNWSTVNAQIPGVGDLLYNGGNSDQRQQKSMAVATNGASEIVIFYTTRNAESGSVILRSVKYNGSWQAPSGPLFTFNPADQNVKVLNAIFYQSPNGEIPVVFLKIGSDYLALSENSDLWQGEISSQFTDAPPPHQLMNTSRFNLSDQFLNLAINPANGDRPAYNDNSAQFLTKDLDGFLYAPQTAVTSIIIHPPGATQDSEKKFWGQFWETTFFPGALAVDNTRDLIYFADYLVGGGSGSGNYGQLRWLPKTYREDFIYTGDWAFPENNGNIPALSTNARFATGLLIDDAAGLLYLGSGLTGEIMKFDISQVTFQNPPIRRANFLSNRSGPLGMVRDENGFFYIVESLAHCVSIFRPDGTFVKSFGAMGRSDGKFVYPTQIAYSEQYHILYVADPMDDRLQVFDKDGAFITQWNTWQSSNPADNFSVIGGIVADGNRLYAGTQSYTGNNKIRIFEIRDLPPNAVRLLLPSNLILIAGTPISFRTSDDWGIVRIDLMVDGSLINSQNIDHVRTLSGSISWDSRRVSEGTHTFEVIATDAGGNNRSSGPVTLDVRYRANVRRIAIAP